MLSTVDKIGGGSVATREVGECEGEGYREKQGLKRDGQIEAQRKRTRLKE
jgi:hypothetical protein